MKEIIALQEYTDKYVSFYEGEIRNISNEIADKLISEGIVAEHDSVSPGGGDGNGINIVTVTATTTDQQTYTITNVDKQFDEIYNGIKDGKVWFGQIKISVLYGGVEMANQTTFISLSISKQPNRELVFGNYTYPLNNNLICLRFELEEDDSASITIAV